MKRILLAAATALAASGAIARAQDVTGAGSTFAKPIYEKWAAGYDEKTHIKINYQGGGSGQGIAQLQSMTIDFGGTDAPMTDSAMALAKGGKVLHIPTVIGAVAMAYNLPSLKTQLKLDGPTLADIFLNKITKWNDPHIAALNPGAALPNKDIVVIHRSEPSGTTFIVTDYFSSVSPEWAKGPGKGTAPAWPVGMAAKGTDGVAGQIQQIEGAIGYVELAYAKAQKLTTALLKNKDGKWVAPSAKGATAAAAGAAASLPANSDFRVSIVNAPGADSYPIASFTWLILYQKQADAAKGKKVVDFFTWAIKDGDAMAESLDYAPLPASLKTKVLARLAEVK